ncbi:MAG: PspC domain-containing protein [Odoribacteraceae bacterium]|jgi:phage shock protein PspC (stress-responsive transcriptional regulator)|nr:PspC domain-containing protein [Odoribacteraceae bacterium]
MKRVEIIHVGGITFNMDDDAANSLATYMEALGNYFRNEPGGREIIADIEDRIAELFSARPGGASAVVTLQDVGQVIDTLGTVRDIIGDSPDAPGNTSDANGNASDANGNATDAPANAPKRQRRRLYRDREERRLGGVCAGIAHYLGIGPVAVRLSFLVVAYSIGCLIIESNMDIPGYIVFGTLFVIALYCLLWIVIPAARTTAQRLEMRGEPVNVTNIGRSVREPASPSVLAEGLSAAGRVTRGFFTVVFRVIVVICGVFFIGAGLGIIVGSIFALFMQDLIFANFIDWNILTFQELATRVISPVPLALLYTFGAISITLLALACLHWGTWLVIGTQIITRKSLHVTFFFIWATATIVAGIVTFTEIRRNIRPGLAQEVIPLPRADTLYIDSPLPVARLDNNPLGAYFDREKNSFHGRLYLSIGRSDSVATLTINKHAYGPTGNLADRYAAGTAHGTIVGDTLLLPRYFNTNPPDKWHFQSARFRMEVPAGTIMIFTDAARELFGYSLWAHALNRNGVHGLVMTEDGVRAWNRDGKEIIINGFGGH